MPSLSNDANPAAGAQNFFGDLAFLAEPAAFTACIAAARRVNWVVYAKKPFGGPAQVLAYLGRYTHRVAIANSRLVSLDDDHVAFTWEDYRQDGATKIMKLKPDEFIRPSFFTRCPTVSTASATSVLWPTAIAPPSSPFAAPFFSIMSGQHQTMASRRPWIQTLRRSPR